MSKLIILGTAHGSNTPGKRSPDGRLREYKWSREIVAMVEDGATVKRFYKENGHFRLQPENDSMDPIIVDSVEILGKVKGLIRMM